MDSLKRRFLLFDSKSKEYQVISAELTEARADAALLDSEFASIRKELDDDLKAFHGWLSTNAPHRDPPAFVFKAAGLVDPHTDEAKSLDVLQATKRVEQMKTFSALVGRWKDLYDLASRYHRWIWEIHAQQLAPIDRKALVSAAVRLLEASNEMYGADDEDDLKDVGAERDLRRVYDSLALLGARYGQPRPTESEPLSKLSHLDLDTFAHEPGTAGFVPLHLAFVNLQGRLPPVRPYSSWLTEGLATSIGGFQGATVAVGRYIGWWFVLAISVAGAALGSFATVNALYTDTFGSRSDYIAVFVAGAGLTVIVQVVIGWAQRRRNPFAVAES